MRLLAVPCRISLEKLMREYDNNLQILDAENISEMKTKLRVAPNGGNHVWHAYLFATLNNWIDY